MGEDTVTAVVEETNENSTNQSDALGSGSPLVAPEVEVKILPTEELASILEHTVDVFIVGGGPAGLSAAVYCTRAGYNTTVAVGEMFGGLVSTTETIENYLGYSSIGGVELAEKFAEHAESLGAKLIEDDEVIELTYSTASKLYTIKLTSGELYYSRAVIYAAGTKPRELPNVDCSQPNVSFCATCDGAFYAGSEVIVVGGGETSAEDILYLSSLCSHITVVLRSNWSASRPLVNKIEELESLGKITIYKNSIIASTEFSGNKIRYIVQPNSSSNHKSEAINTINSRENIVAGSADGLFVAIGQDPQSKLLEKLSLVGDDGFILASQSPGLFIAGDIRDPEYRQIAVAVGDGAKAGIDAARFLSVSD